MRINLTILLSVPIYQKSVKLLILICLKIYWVNLIHLLFFSFCYIIRWNKVFKNGPSKSCGRHPLKNFTWPILEYYVPDGLLTFFT